MKLWEILCLDANIVFQDNGLSDLLLVYAEKTALRQFNAAHALLTYKLFIVPFIDNNEADTMLCKRILDDKMSTYLKGVFFQFFKGRYHLIQVLQKI